MQYALYRNMQFVTSQVFNPVEYNYSVFRGKNRSIQCQLDSARVWKATLS